MGNMGSTTLFIVASFVFAWAIIARKESLPERLRRPLATIAIGLILFAFALIVISLYNLS
jgi:cytochrome c oxidase assembly factor CtaG